MSTRASFLAVVIVAGLAGAASAAPISYVFKGVGSGQLGDTAFTRKAFTITTIADTSGIVSDSSPSGVLQQVNNTSASVDIEGLGSATFLINSRVFLLKPSSGDSAVGFSRTPLDGGLDMYDLRGAVLNGYSLENLFAESPVPVLFSGQWLSTPVALTTAGVLNIASGVTNGSFAAIPVPTPGAAAALGLAGLVATRRRRS